MLEEAGDPLRAAAASRTKHWSGDASGTADSVACELVGVKNGDLGHFVGVSGDDAAAHR